MSSVALYKALIGAGAREDNAHTAADDVADRENPATKHDIPAPKAELKGDIAGVFQHLWIMGARIVAATFVAPRTRASVAGSLPC